MEESTYSAFDIKELKEELETQREELNYHQSVIDDINEELGRRKSEIRDEYQKELNNLVNKIVDDGFNIRFVHYDNVCPNNIKYNLFVDYNTDEATMV